MAWELVRTNLFANPRGTTASATYWGVPAAGFYSLVTDMTGPINTAVRWQRSTSDTGAVRHLVGTDMPDNTELVRYQAYVRLSDPMTVNIYARPNLTSNTNQALLTSMNLPAGDTVIDVVSGSFVGNASANSGISILITSGPNGSTFDITSVLIESVTAVYSPPTEVRRNLITNPSFEDGTSTNWLWSGDSFSRDIVADWSFSGTQSVSVVSGNNHLLGDYRSADGGANSFGFGTEPGKTYTMSAYVNYGAAHLSFSTAAASRQRRIMFFYSTNGVTYTADFGPQAPNTAGVHRLTHTFTVPANATGTIVGVGMAGSSSDDGLVVQKLDAVLLEEGSVLNTYYDGSTPDNGTDEYYWVGDTNLSASIYGTRTLTGYTPADSSYFDGYTRVPMGYRARWTGDANASTSVIEHYPDFDYSDIGYEYYASLSPLFPKYVYTRQQHEAYYYGLFIDDPYVDLRSAATEFYTENSGLTPASSYTVSQHVSAYFDSLVYAPIAWRNLVETEALYVVGGEGVPGAITAIFKQATVDPVNLTTYTLAAQSIGSAFATRRVVVAMTTSSARAITSVTIGGVAATIDATHALGGTARLGIASAVVPTGTTADVVVLLNGSASYLGIAVWTLDTGNPTGQIATGSGDPINLNVTTVAGDAVIAVAHTTGIGTALFEWSNATVRFVEDVETTTESYSGADTIASGTSVAINLNPSSVNTVAVAAAYG